MVFLPLAILLKTLRAFAHLVQKAWTRGGRFCTQAAQVRILALESFSYVALLIGSKDSAEKKLNKMVEPLRNLSESSTATKGLEKRVRSTSRFLSDWLVGLLSPQKSSTNFEF